MQQDLCLGRAVWICVWVWPGDQAQADPTLIPHLDWAVSDNWAYGGGLFNIQCDYRLMIDNLMDLTHET
ncbi:MULTISPECIES: hypothetical protein [unclassified Pseudomonas]|uniref:hypothetical protein n=1 Tax=unclassified Pseudomonas TaxID=196821 RepID=UPI003FA75748